MVIQHSVKELLAKNSVTRPMKYIVVGNTCSIQGFKKRNITAFSLGGFRNSPLHKKYRFKLRLFAEVNDFPHMLNEVILYALQ